MSGHAPLHVLIVDDSAVVRHTVSLLLRPEDGWRLSVAPDPVVGLDRIRTDPPDVILLDLEMPRMDGLTFLRHLMALQPIPVVVCSGYARHGTGLALSALDAGAVEIFPKPRLAVKEFLQDAAPSLAAVLRRAVTAAPSLRRVWRSAPPSAAPMTAAGGPAAGRGPEGPPRPDGPAVVEPTAAPRRGRPAGGSASPGVVLLGASMGGPEAIRRVLGGFPEDGPACVVVQHMPERFTAEFARRLDGTVAMDVREAVDGDPVLQGRVLIAPGGRHLVLESGPRGPVVRCTDGPPVQGHRPSVDVLFESAARVLGSRAVAAVLTGMGEDGAAGLLALSRAGARTVVQDRTTATIFGMPGSALSRGGAQRTVGLSRMARVLLDLASTAPDERNDGDGAAEADPFDRTAPSARSGPA